MLQLLNTRVFKSVNEELAPGAAVAEEGVALTYVRLNGSTYVQPCTGAAGEIFAGLAMIRNIPPSHYPVVEEVIVGVDGSFELSHVPVTGNVLIKLGTSALTIGTTAPADETQVELNGADGNVVVALAGKKLVAQYQYEMTVAEARQLLGDYPYGGNAANLMGFVTAIKQATPVATSFFDASKDWTNALGVVLASDGRLAPAARPSDAIPNVVLKNTPNAANPFVVIELNLG